MYFTKPTRLIDVYKLCEAEAVADALASYYARKAQEFRAEAFRVNIPHEPREREAALGYRKYLKELAARYDERVEHQVRLFCEAEDLIDEARKGELGRHPKACNFFVERASAHEYAIRHALAIMPR